jgi:hypothetical protein
MRLGCCPLRSVCCSPLPKAHLTHLKQLALIQAVLLGRFLLPPLAHRQYWHILVLLLLLLVVVWHLGWHPSDNG